MHYVFVHCRTCDARQGNDSTCTALSCPQNTGRDYCPAHMCRRTASHLQLLPYLRAAAHTRCLDSADYPPVAASAINDSYSDSGAVSHWNLDDSASMPVARPRIPALNFSSNASDLGAHIAASQSHVHKSVSRAGSVLGGGGGDTTSVWALSVHDDSEVGVAPSQRALPARLLLLRLCVVSGPDDNSVDSVKALLVIPARP